VRGKRHGDEGDETDQAVAKPGYAVGAINADTGLVINGFEVIFMRVQGDRLDPNDSYKSKWLGGNTSSAEDRLDSEGKPVVGIHGVLKSHVKGLGLSLAP